MLASPAAAPISIKGRQAGNTGVSGESAITMSKSKNERSSRQMTESESIFEKFLEKNELPFERMPVANTPRPDYFVTIGASKLTFEVKELSSDENFKTEPFAVSSRTLGNHIRDKISMARHQIRFGAGQSIPSILVIYNNMDPFQMFGTEDLDFRAAMYGAPTVVIDKSSGKILDSFQGRNKSFTRERKAYFSALARLSTYNNQITLTLFENIFAAVPVAYDSLPTCFEVVRFEQTTTPVA